MLIRCSECGGEVSNQASFCPHCGLPIKKEEIVSPWANLPIKKGISIRNFVIGTVLLFSIVFSAYFVYASQNPGVDLIRMFEGLTQGHPKVINVKSTNPAKPNVLETTAPINESDGSKTYPVQKVNLWNYQFYTTQIPSQNIDIGSLKKQQIAGILEDIKYPNVLTNNLTVAYVDPGSVTSKDYIYIPWIQNRSPVYQVRLGGFSDFNGNGGIIYINSTDHSDFKTTLVHELGHRLAQRMTKDDWAKFYSLRGIPANTPQRMDEWAKSPQEDFAEVYRVYIMGGSVRTVYGPLVGDSYADMISGCFMMEGQKLINCRYLHSQNYQRTISSATKQFIADKLKSI